MVISLTPSSTWMRRRFFLPRRIIKPNCPNIRLRPRIVAFRLSDADHKELFPQVPLAVAALAEHDLTGIVSPAACDIKPLISLVYIGIGATCYCDSKRSTRGVIVFGNSTLEIRERYVMTIAEAVI